MGAPHRYDNPEVRKRLVEAVRAGAHYGLAAQYAGIDRTTFQRWLQKGREGDPLFADLVAEIEQAEAQNAVVNLGLIRKAAMAGTWQAAAWILERRHPQMYGRTVVEQRVEMVSDPEAKLRDLLGLTPEKNREPEPEGA